MAYQLIRSKSYQLKTLFDGVKIIGLPRVMPVRATSNNYVDSKMGKREIVGFGVNSNSIYVDWTLYPFPGVRFREETPEIAKLREKEKGDWKNLTGDEMKQLYRASFCQTFAEMQAPTGSWKLVLSHVLHILAIALALAIFQHKFLYEELPPTFSDERIKAQFQRIIDLEVNPITGITAEYRNYVEKRTKH